MKERNGGRGKRLRRQFSARRRRRDLSQIAFYCDVRPSLPLPPSLSLSLLSTFHLPPMRARRPLAFLGPLRRKSNFRPSPSLCVIIFAFDVVAENSAAPPLIFGARVFLSFFRSGTVPTPRQLVHRCRIRIRYTIFASFLAFFRLLFACPRLPPSLPTSHRSATHKILTNFSTPRIWQSGAAAAGEGQPDREGEYVRWGNGEVNCDIIGEVGYLGLFILLQIVSVSSLTHHCKS